MTNPALAALYEQYPAIIAQMPGTFTSHEFILKLAQQHQRLYIEALYHYRTNPREAPFMILHGLLAKHLGSYPNLVAKIGCVDSRDIFGRSNGCESWKKP